MNHRLPTIYSKYFHNGIFITARIRRMGEGNVFSLFTLGGVSPAGVGGSVQPGGGSVQLAGGVSPARGVSVQLAGGVNPAGGVSPASRGEGQSSWRGESAKIGLTTRQAVCLLCSCRRTFLFELSVFWDTANTGMPLARDHWPKATWFDFQVT